MDKDLLKAFANAHNSQVTVNLDITRALLEIAKAIGSQPDSPLIAKIETVLDAAGKHNDDVGALFEAMAAAVEQGKGS